MPSALSAVVDLIKKPYAILFSTKRKDVQFAALEQRLEDTRKVNDVAERLIAAEKLHADASDAGFSRLLSTHPLRFFPSLVTLGVIGAAVVSPLIAAPIGTVLLSGAFAGMMASMVTGMASWIVLDRVDENSKAAQHVRAATSAIIKDAPKSGNFLSIAQSPHFDDLMKKYPALKDSFLLASAREKTAQDLSTVTIAVPERKRQLNV